MTTSALKRTPFHDIHAALGAKIVPFAGYEMPVQYPHGHHRRAQGGARAMRAVRRLAHGRVHHPRRPQAVDFVNYVTTNDVAALAIGQVHYSTILNERGTIEDDCLVYRVRRPRHDGRQRVEHRQGLRAHRASTLHRFDVTLEDISDDIALLALQGPKAARDSPAAHRRPISRTIKYYHFAEGDVAGMPTIISRTGYTGEDGFELYFANDSTPNDVERADLAAGDVTPAGLGARDTLRLEMGMALYGNDIDDTVTPLEANLGWLVKLKKGDFVGSDALGEQKAAAASRGSSSASRSAERDVPRATAIRCSRTAKPSGVVCSGTMSPTLGIPIGTAILPDSAARRDRRSRSRSAASACRRRW